ncbi:MAG TPA: WG repeat-containing protein, partial [Bacteroidia bacterium]|nr:WG repeat-containing protein [Bacteroidia bacterium]
KKAPNAYASYGLATIFSRNDNPFSNSDSASKYVCQAYSQFRLMQKPLKVKGLRLDTAVILSMADSIAGRQLQTLKKENSVAKFDRFLLTNYLASPGIISEAVYLRDEIEFNRALNYNRSDSTREFILTHPRSNFFIEAMLLGERQIYDEVTADKTADSYKLFLKTYPKNNLRNLAYERLFEIYRQGSDLEGLKFFVANYPNAPQSLEAWKLLFSLFVRSYTNSELKNFLEAYPAFPLKNSILKEVELNNIALFPYQRRDLTGFINSTGQLVIQPMYDAVTDFQEGLSVVSKNDSVFFVNKENNNVFGKFFSEAFTFKNGIAPVKQNNKWFFINRLGQQVSKFYNEISESSNSAFIVKVNDKYGAVDNFGQEIIAPKYIKLGDFKNEFAYYIEDNKYGFVSKVGGQHRAEFEWISDFNNKQVAIIKKDGLYGLINAQGTYILEPQYDQVLKTNTPVFIVVWNNNYGFFSSEGCFLSQVAYEYSKDKPAEFYTNGDYFKLIKKGEQSLVDKNGRTLISFDQYNEINFFSDGLMRVRKDIKKEPKYGFLDKKLLAAIPLKYQQAGDFSDSVAIVKSKDKFIMLSHSGKELLISDYQIEKLTAHYYMLDDGFKQLVNQEGVVVFS